MATTWDVFEHFRAFKIILFHAGFIYLYIFKIFVVTLVNPFNLHIIHIHILLFTLHVPEDCFARNWDFRFKWLFLLKHNVILLKYDKYKTIFWCYICIVLHVCCRILLLHLMQILTQEFCCYAYFSLIIFLKNALM